MRTFGELARAVDGTWVIPELEPHVRIKLKAVFPKVPKTGLPPFVFPNDPATATDLLWFMDRYPLKTSASNLKLLGDRRREYEQAQVDVARIFSDDYAVPAFVGLKPGQEVRLHQARNVELLARFEGLLVADKVGKGKTYTAGAACLLPGALPATIVVPPNLRIQWAKKLQEFTDLTVHVVQGTKPYPLPPVDVRIFGFTQIAGWIDVLELLGTGLAVADEGHELRHGVVTSKGFAVARLFELARMRMMLTGTPVFHYGADIWTLLNYVRPEVLGLYPDFAREWCSGGGPVKDPVALGTYLREQHAMTREEGDEPEANRIVETIPHDVEHLASVEDALAALAQKAAFGSFEVSGQATRELDLRVRMETGIAKAPFVAKFVRGLIETTGETVMLFGWHREVYDIWCDELSDLGIVMYTGTETPAEKNRSVQRFLAGEAKVFIISLRSGAGLDGLQHCCSTVIFGELDWSPAMHDQCIGRVNREGQIRWKDGRTTDAIFLVAEDGSDPPMQSMLGLKASQAAGISDLGVTARAETDRKPIEMLISRYLDKGRAA